MRRDVDRWSNALVAFGHAPERKNVRANIASRQSRGKELRLARYRIERGRAHTAAVALNVWPVVQEAVVTPALIHKPYASIAEQASMKLGACSHELRDAARDEIKLEQQRRANRGRSLLKPPVRLRDWRASMKRSCREPSSSGRGKLCERVTTRYQKTLVVGLKLIVLDAIKPDIFAYAKHFTVYSERR